MSHKCRDCGGPLPAGFPTCPECRRRATCPECGTAKGKGDVNFCPNCLLNLALKDQEIGAKNAPQPGTDYSHESSAQWIGRYRLRETIGEGAFGTVWMAEQEQPVRRCVALKIVKLGMDTKQVVARFEAERQALALMDHPNIARVYDGGATETGRPYFVMELVRGLPITEFCDARKLSTRERIELFLEICHAIQHAHQKGVIHRDLKPSNLLVTEHDGKAVPKVLDFGIAKATASPLTDRTLLTGFNQFIGTPVYMSPEQAGLGGLDIDSRSDIYSLGVLLYELLTSRVPLNLCATAEPGYDTVLGTIREKEPLKPSRHLSTVTREELTHIAARRSTQPEQLNRLLRGELDWLILKALEKDRNRRYQTANEFAGDLRNYLYGDPISAAPPSIKYQIGKFARKHRHALSTAAALLLVLTAGLVATTWQAFRATRFAQSESALRADSDRRREDQRMSLYASEMALAFRSWEAGEAEHVRQIIARQPEDLRGWEWHYLRERSRPREVEAFANQPGYVATLAFSRDATRLAVASGGSGNVRIWDINKRRLLIERNVAPGIIDDLAFAADAKGLYFTDRSTNFHLLDPETLDERATFVGHSQPVISLAVHPGGDILISGSAAETLLWDLNARETIFRFPETLKDGGVQKLSRSGRYLCRANNTGTAEIWDINSQRQTAEIKTLAGAVFTAAFSPDESLLALGGDEGFVSLWNWQKGYKMGVLGPHVGPVRHLDFSPDGKRLVTSSSDSIVRIWDVASQREQASLRGHRGRVHTAAFSPDGRWIVSRGGPDQTLRFWNAEERDPEITLDRAEASLGWCRFVEDTNVICALRTTGRGSTLKIWKNLRSIREITSAEPLYFTSIGSNIVFAIAGKHEVSIQDSCTGAERKPLKSPFPLLGSMAASRNGQWLASAAAPNYIIVWDVSTGRSASLFLLPGGAQFSSMAGSASLQFNADGDALWVAHPNWPEIIRCDWRSTISWKILKGHARGVSSLALSTDGTLLASGSTDMTVGLWDATTGENKGFLGGENGGVISLGFSSDDRTLAMGCFDGQVRLWNVPARSEITTLFSHKSTVYSVAFSRDGSLLASSSDDGTTCLWQAPTKTGPK